MNKVIVDELLVTYSRAGKGQVVLLLHGWGDRAVTFSRLKEELSSNYDVVSVDLPGFGGSDAPKAAWNLTDYSEFIANFLEKVGISDVFAVVGHSNGGAIAIRAIGNETLEAKKLILLASSGVRSHKSLKKKILPGFSKVAHLAIQPLPETTKRRLKRSVYGKLGSDAYAVEHMRPTFEKIIVDDVQQDAKKVHIPTVLIYGAEDPDTPPQQGEILRSCIHDSKLTVLPGVGHFVHHDAPDEVLKIIEESLDE